jgi:hypothetical protein
MGTVKEWMEVVFAAAFWAVVMGVTETRGWFFGPDDPPFDWSRVPGLILGGLLFGIVIVFEWRALHPPILYVMLSLVAAAIWLRLKIRIRQRKNPTGQPSLQ